MKTSHILSTLAALGIFLSLVAAPVAPRNNASDLMNSSVSAGLPVIVRVLTDETNTGSDVATFIASNVAISDLSYLKFNADNYAKADLSLSESLEMPSESAPECSVNAFDANNYNELTTDGIHFIEMPDGTVESNFDYIKFDANQYIDKQALENGNYGEMPAAE